MIFLFLGGAAAIPLFYLPALFFDSTTNFSIVVILRFRIIHLWVEGFFELFVTVMVAVTFFQLRHDFPYQFRAGRILGSSIEKPGRPFSPGQQQ